MFIELSSVRRRTDFFLLDGAKRIKKTKTKNCWVGFCPPKAHFAPIPKQPIGSPEAENGSKSGRGLVGLDNADFLFRGWAD